ncbi:tetratricopeptide repeat protein 4 homolog [Arachis ipaensis]|uniref:tetratricopeptide repeat protein 4 homolog n=1 Tax=Arachis ipaensis TaxID=130454 RepID=UPI0007AF1C42|nr:tetratricopeptide repeat protein 4 homolog [Arachis ipaensis]XP_025632590.1 tetratricopeptide repeat protein 4 homolog [Arachis hypogaea]
MALWMEKGTEPLTEAEKADLEAIAAIKESAAIELKEKGNEYVKKGKKHYSEAIDCYTRAINQKALSDSESSVLFANRAHVNLLLGNHRRALSDAQQALNLSPSNIKAIYRAVKASLSLNLLAEAQDFCRKGLQLDPNNEELKRLDQQIHTKISEKEKREAEVSKAISEAEELVSAIENRGLKIGKAMYRELTGLKKPVLDKNNILHWPVLLLYAEVMSSDFIEDLCETDMLSVHLDMMFSADQPLPWDVENNYKRDFVELYYEAGSGVRLSKEKLLHCLLEGTAASHVSDEEKDAVEDFKHGAGSRKWIKVNEKKMLQDILKEPNFVIPEIPVFYVVSKQSSFYSKFKSGKWAPPSI